MPFKVFSRRYNQKLQVRHYRNIWVRDRNTGLYDPKGPSGPECNEFPKSVYFASKSSNSQNICVKNMLKIQSGRSFQP